MAEQGGFLNAPDVYMDKIAVGGGLPDGVVDLDADAGGEPARRSPRPRRSTIADLVVCILDRPRHAELIAKVREAGARIMLITDGDVAGVIATSRPDSGIDIYMGSGGAPEGVLAAAALRCIGGQMQGRLLFRNDDERSARAQVGHQRPQPHLRHARPGQGRRDVRRHRRHRRHDAARRAPLRAAARTTHSIVMRSKTGTVRIDRGEHNFARKPVDSGRPAT